MSHLQKSIFYITINLTIILTLNFDSKFLQLDSYKTEYIENCIVAVVNADEYRTPTVIIISDVNTNESAKNENCHLRRLTQKLSSAYISQIIIKDLQYLNETVDKIGENVLIVVFVDSCETLEQLDVTTINDTLRYLMIVNESLDEEWLRVLEEIGRTLQHYDATFILKDESKYKLQTTIPQIDENTCYYDEKREPTLINTCIDGILDNKVIFPTKKPKNLKKCPFNLGMATMYPYSMIDNKESLQNLQPINESQIRGSDFEIIKIISNYYNASLRLYYIYREEESPYFHLEYVPFLLNGSFDACAGGLFRIYGDLVSYSGIYSRQAVIWVYGVEREATSWQTFVGKINGLYIFILFYFCYSIIWILFCTFNRLAVSSRNTFLYSWGALMGTASLQDSRTWKQQLLNMSYLTLCLHLSAYVSIQLYSFLTIQGPPEVLRTNDEIMESGRTPYLNYETKFFVEDVKYKAFANTSQDCRDFQDCENKAITNQGLTAIPEGYFYPFQVFTAVENEARVLRASENIFILYHEMITRKKSPFVGKFQTIVQSLFEAGICSQLYLDAIGLLIEAKAKSANANILANSYSCETGCAITITQIAGAFYVCIFGYALSFFVFMIEIMIKKEINLRTLRWGS